MANEETMFEEEYFNFEDLGTPAELAWSIKDDSAADWAVRKVQWEKQEYLRLKKIADEQIARIESAITSAEERMNRRNSFLTGKLAEYFLCVPHRETKTQEQYQLLSGKLVFTKPKMVMEKDDGTLVEYLKHSGNAKYVKVEEKPAWAEFKKNLAVIDGKAVNTATGEVVDCIEVSEKPGTFEVK